MDFPASVKCGSVYWVQGRTQPTRHTRYAPAITNPPCGGWGTVILLPDIDFLFAPVVLQGYHVYDECAELRSFKESDTTRERISGYLLDKVKRTPARQIDIPSCLLVFKELELDFPFDEQNVENFISGGQYAESNLFVPVNPESRRGQALKLALSSKTIPEIMLELTASRRAVLSLFYQLHKFHGIGYKLFTNQSITIELPRGELWKQTSN